MNSIVKNNRTQQCVDLEMFFDGNGFYGQSEYNKDFNIHSIDIAFMEDEAWDKMITKMTAILRERKGVRVYNKPVRSKDHIMTVKDWEQEVEYGSFTNDDGNGYWMKDGLACRDEVFSSEPLDATHMVWYNK